MATEKQPNIRNMAKSIAEQKLQRAAENATELYKVLIDYANMAQDFKCSVTFQVTHPSMPTLMQRIRSIFSNHSSTAEPMFYPAVLVYEPIAPESNIEPENNVVSQFESIDNNGKKFVQIFNRIPTSAPTYESNSATPSRTIFNPYFSREQSETLNKLAEKLRETPGFKIETDKAHYITIIWYGTPEPAPLFQLT